MAAAELLADPGVLIDRPCAEWGGTTAVERVGGWAILPLKGDCQRARGRVDAAPDPSAVEGGLGELAQAVVHVHKSRAGTWADLAAAWSTLASGGRLIVVGPNELGIATTAKRLGKELGQQPEVVANRAKARAVVLVKDGGPGPHAPPAELIALELGAERFELRSSPGTFGAGKLDRGSALLLAQLKALGDPARVVDLGAGCGVLGLAAARRWPAAEIELLEVDHRAYVDARANAEILAPGRARVRWWDSELDPAPPPTDAVVCNPPFHRGKGVDYGPARGMFRAIADCLRPGGTALVVANRQLPYERELTAIGAVDEVAAADGFKLLRVER